MPFNGSGTFTRLYSWVQDAANGIDILSTRMDNEMNGMATALSDCVTRDGQSPWTANLPAGGFKITGLGTPTSSADSATKGYVDGIAQGEWKAESNSFAWVSGTQFKLTGVNLTAIYHVGRRVKIVHNSGGSTAYATITATAYSTDTTVTVVTDDGTALVSSITAVSYGIISYVSPSYLDPRSEALLYNTSNQSYVASAAAQVTLQSALFDTRSETSASTFTARAPGYYRVSGAVALLASSGGVAVLFLRRSLGSFPISYYVLQSVPSVQGMRTEGLFSLAAGETVQLWLGCSQNMTIESNGTDCFLAVSRVA